jgi:hypothetical protein
VADDATGGVADGVAPGLSQAERRRNGTYQRPGYGRLPVLKTGWGTSPVPLRREGYGQPSARVYVWATVVPGLPAGTSLPDWTASAYCHSTSG